MKIFLIGYMGSGKSHTGKELAKLLNLQFIDLDQLIETEENKTISEIFETKSEKYFRILEKYYLETTHKIKDAVIACGGGTPCFYENMSWMNENGMTIYLRTQPTVLVERLLPEIEKRPLLKGKSEKQLIDYISDKLEDRSEWYEQAQIIYHQVSQHEEIAPKLKEHLDKLQEV